MRHETKPMPRSLFDALKAKHPEPSEGAGAGRPARPPRRPRPPMLRPVGRSARATAGLVTAIVILFVCGGLGLLSPYRPPVGPAPVVEKADVEKADVDPATPEGPTAEPPLVRAEAREPEGERVASLERPAAAPLAPAPLAPAPPPAPLKESRPEAEDRPPPVRPGPEPAAEPEPPEAVAEIRPAVKVFSAQPDYPEAARRSGLSGTVIVEAEIDAAGSVAETRVLRGVSPELDQAARESVGRWRFEPATSNGEPTTDVYRTAIHFEIQPAAEPEPEVAALPEADDFEPPVRLYSPPPSYPPADWVAAVEGDVVVEAAISETGLVTGVEILQGLSAGLNKAAIEALKHWRFRPATRQGRAVAASQVLTFRFAR